MTARGVDSQDTLFVPECDEWINACRPVSWNERRSQRYCYENRSHNEECREVQRWYAKQHRLEISCEHESTCDAERESGCSDSQSLPENEQQDVGPLGTYCEPDSDLLGSLRYEVCEKTVEPNCRKSEC